VIRATPSDLLRRWQTEGARPRTLQAVLDWVAWALRGRRAEEAAAVLRELLAIKEHPSLWGFLAQAETAAGNPGKAAEALVRHLKLEPSPAVWVAAVDAFVEAGRRDRARALVARAPGEELKAFLVQRLRQATGRSPRPKAPKTLEALVKLDRGVLMAVLGKLPMETVAAAVGAAPEPVRDAVLECFSGGPKRRLASLMGRELDAKARAAARRALLGAAR